MSSDLFPGFPNSTRQSLTNPIQVDRLPDQNELQTDFPASAAPQKVVRNAALRLVGLSAFIAIWPSLADSFLPVLWATEIWMLFGAFASFIVLVIWLGKPKSILGWTAYAVFLPIALLILLFLRSAFALLCVASVCTILAVDKYAKQALHLGTTSPLPRAQSKFIRGKWSSRLFSLNTVRGLELYGVGILALLLTPWILESLIPAEPTGAVFDRFKGVLVALGLLFCIPVIIEIIAAILFARRTLGIQNAWNGFKRSLRDWLTYNYTNVRSPGLLVSPVGSVRLRRILTVAIICTWVAAINPLFSYKVSIHDSIRTARIQQDAKLKKEQHDAQLKAEQDFLRKIRGGSEPNLKTFQPPPNTADSPPITQPQPLQIQPFQQRMLDRMPEADRAKYLEQLNAANQQKAEEKKTQTTKSFSQAASQKLDDALFEVYNPHATLDYSKGENSRPVLIYTMLAFLLVIPKVVVFGFSLLFPVAFAYANTVRLASSLRQQLEANPDSILSLGNWDRLVTDVATSTNPTEAQSVLLGVNVHDNSPVLVPTKVFEEHAHILGDSGSGKTALGISLILNQLIKQPDCSIIVIDLKGDDMSLFEGTRRDAENAGKCFRWFTNELGRSTYAFNPLDQEYFRRLSLYQKTDIVTASLGLQYGTDYGRGYFSDANSDYLYRTIQAHPGIKSFEHLARILPSGYGVENVTYEMRKAASHIVSISQRLATTKALNIVEHSEFPQEVIDRRIEFADVFRQPQVIYFNLPSTLGTASSAEIARIALYSLIGSARLTPEPERKQVFVVIDEFQRILANNLELIMQTARSMKVGLILANQSMLDLKKADTDLTPAVKTNTRFKQIFAASNFEELRELVDASGETIVYQRSFMAELGNALATFGGITKITASETISPRLRTNDILLATDAEQQSIVQVRRGMGYAQYGGFPFVMRSTYHISKDEFRERKKASWPESVPGTFEATEVVQKSLLDEFPQVAPLASESPTAKSSSASGIADLLDQTYNSQSSKRSKYSNKKPPNE